MFDFIFKRSASKTPESPTAAAEPAAAAAAQAQAQAQAARRAQQLAGARELAGDEAAAVALILSSDFADVRLAAAEHVRSQAMLEQVHQAMRNTDRRVAKLVQGRLDLIRHELAEQNRAQAAIDQAQRMLADEKLSPNQVAELDRVWLVIQAGAALAEQFAALRGALGQRLEAQVRLQRSALDALAELRRVSGAGQDAQTTAQQLQRLAAAHAAHLADAERASLPKHLPADFAAAYAAAQAVLATLTQHQAAFDARRAALAEWQGAEPAGLKAEQLTRAWQHLPRLPDGELASQLQQQFEALLATVPAPLAAPDQPAKPAKSRQERAASAAPREAGADFAAALDGLEAALQQGLLQIASEHDKALRDMKPGRLTPAQSERLAQVRAEFKRLADWARWGGNVSREELVKAADEMPAQGLPVTELAKKVGSLRERWKSLDTLSGPAPKSLWERFDAACTAAYAPAAAHFKQLAEERHSNAAKAQELVAETLAEVAALAAAGGADWKPRSASVQRLRLAWTRLGAIDRKEKKRLEHEFDQAMEALAAPLEQQRKLEVARREQLIAEVAQLKPTERNTLDMLRALQEKWQEQAKALPLERRIEQALWLRFRAACDEVFAKRKETANAADNERKGHLDAKEAVCAGLEAFVAPAGGSDKSQAAAVAGVLREARNAWNAIGPVPRAAEQKIEQRYQAAVAAVQAHADAIVQRAGAAQANALRDKLRLCQQLENAVAQGGASDGAQDGAAAQADREARWSALPPLDPVYERALQSRFAAACKALAEPAAAASVAYAATLEANRGKLLAEVLRLEIVAGVDSGAEFARERLKMQVEVLQSSLKSGQKPAAQDAHWLPLCTLPALADARTASRIEMLLRRAGGAAAAK